MHGRILEYDLQAPSYLFLRKKLGFFQSKIAIPTVITEIMFSSLQFSIEYCCNDTDIILSLCAIDEIADIL